MLRNLLTHLLAVWAGGFVAIYWMCDMALRGTSISITSNDILHFTIWPYHIVQYIWELV